MAISGLEKIEEENPVDRDILTLFDKMTEIPRPSGKEAAMMTFIVAQLLGIYGDELEGKVDDAGNMAIHLAANDERYSNSPRVVIQGHADMVCHNGNDKRAVSAKVDGDRIIAPDETLGADNALGGIAIPLAILRNKDFKHGPITLLVTVREEKGMAGAAELDPTLIPEDSAIFLNIDSEEGPDRIFYGSAGGTRMNAQFDISEKTAVPEDYEVMQIDLFGFPGGHSGLTIYKRPLNAIKEMVSLLLELQEAEDFRLIQISGGENSNDVPTASMAQIAFPKAKRAALNKMIEGICLREGGSVRMIGVERLEDKPYLTITDCVKKALLKALNELPQGPLKTLDGDENHVITSNNVATLRTLDNTIDILVMARSNEDGELDETERKIRGVLTGNGATMEILRKYYGWREDRNSPAIALIQAASREVVGREPTLEEAHCGLETGTIARRILPRTIAMGSFGPKIGGAHGAGEYVIIEDIFATRKMLETILERVAMGK